MNLFGPVTVVLLLWVCAPAWGQGASLPSAPGVAPDASMPSAPAPAAATSGKPLFAVPPPTYTRPVGPAPDPKKGWVCDAPPEGVFLQGDAVPEELKGEVRNYVQLVYSQLYQTWVSHLPRGAHNAWAAGRVVKVRFAIMADGTFSNPEVTVSSGAANYDSAASDAVRLRGAFPPLPTGYKGPLAMCMTFKTNTGLPDTPQGWYKEAKP